MTPRLLLVDDESNVLRSLTRALQFNFEITTAYSAEEAKILLTRPRAFDVVISDIKMPGQNGLDFVDEVGPLYDSIRFIVLSGCNDHETMQRVNNMPHLFRFLSKPARLEDVTSAIQDAIESLVASA